MTRQAEKTHCPQGHEYNETNTYTNPKTGHRFCRVCRRAGQERLRREQGLEIRGESRLCRRGMHEMSGENVITWRGKARQCRMCLESAKAARSYGMDRDEYETLRNNQDNICSACGEAEIRKTPTGRTAALHIDHDHETGKVRGLICMRCNLALGHVRDSVEVLKKLIAYLEGQG